uniref:Protein arginine N-methyltransferase n=2 Tax=Schistocephalus solidus TaxID=70667 RepID=A0A0X3PEN6_SCHSO
MAQGDRKSINGSFVCQVSPITGSVQWNLVDVDYAFEQEIARSAYADMLHDWDRNRKYHEAICHVIRNMKSTDPHRLIHVLDIGTGTGILAMMAARAGADTVTACEAFLPVARCARRVVQANGLQDRVRVIGKRSTDLLIGHDMEQRANVLVAELLDTELIGEGALETYKHAAEHLLTPDAVLIPCKANMFMQVLDSPFLWSHHKICPVATQGSGVLHPQASIFPTRSIQDCAGCPSVFDIQVSQLPLLSEAKQDEDHRRGYVKCLLDAPLQFHEFVFSPPSSNIRLHESKRIIGKARIDGTAHAFVVWWGLQMEPSGTVAPISTAPSWAGETTVWRDHWMQAIYFPRRPLNLFCGQPFAVDFAHDAVSMWFDIAPVQSAQPTVIERPVCTCGAHVAWPRSRIAEINCGEFQEFRSKLADGVSKYLSECVADTVALVMLADASTVPLAIINSVCASTKCSSKSINFFHYECSPLSARLMRSVYSELPEAVSTKVHMIQNFDDLQNAILDLSAKSNALEIYVLGEPYVLAGILPWNALNFWYLSGEIESKLPRIPIKLLFPSRLRVWAVAMDFDNLWKIRAPVGSNCEGFDLREFDELVLSAARNTDAPVEPQPLWEYTGKARSEPKIVFDIDLQIPPVISRRGPVPPNCKSCIIKKDCKISLSSSSVNAVAFWAEWLTDLETESWRAVAGPSSPVKVDEEVEWCQHGPQNGVFIFSEELKEKVKSGFPCMLSVSADFDYRSGELSFAVDARPP